MPFVSLFTSKILTARAWSALGALCGYVPARRGRWRTPLLVFKRKVALAALYMFAGISVLYGSPALAMELKKDNRAVNKNLRCSAYRVAKDYDPEMYDLTIACYNLDGDLVTRAVRSDVAEDETKRIVGYMGAQLKTMIPLEDRTVSVNRTQEEREAFLQALAGLVDWSLAHADDASTLTLTDAGAELDEIVRAELERQKHPDAFYKVDYRDVTYDVNVEKRRSESVIRVYGPGLDPYFGAEIRVQG